MLQIRNQYLSGIGEDRFAAINPMSFLIHDEMDQMDTPEVETNAQPPKLSATCTPAKKQIAGWLLVVLLFVCSPLILFELIWWLPDFLFWIVFVGAPLVVLVTMWRKRTWKTWVKLMWTLAYVIIHISGF